MAKGLVGLEGRGEATIFGGTTNPIAVYMQTQAARQRQQQQQQAAQEKQVQESLDYLDKMKASSKFDEMNRELAMDVKGVSEGFRDYMRRNQNNPNALQMASSIAANQHREILAKADEMNAWKSEIDNADKEIDDLQEKGIYWSGEDNPQGINAKWELRKLWRNPDGTIKPSDEVRGYIHNLDKYKNDPRLINPNGATKNWINGLEEQARHYVGTRKGAIGYNEDTLENTVKSKLQYEMDGTNLKLDENNLPIPIVNDFTLGLAMQDKHMRSLINANGGSTNESRKQYLKSLITPGQDIKDYGDPQVTLGRRIPESGSGSTKVNTDIEIVPKGAVTYKSEITPNDFSGNTPIGVSGPSLDIQNVLPIQNRNIEVTDNQGNKQKAQILGFQVDEGGKQKILVNGFDNLGKVIDKPFTIPMSEENLQRLLNTPMTNQKRTELVKAINDFKKMPVDQNFADPAKLDSGINQIAKAFNPEGKLQSANNFDSGVASENLRNIIVNEMGISKIRVTGDDGIERIEDVTVDADSGNTRWNNNTVKINGQSFDLNEEGIKKLKIFLLKNAPDKFIKGGSGSTTAIPQGKVR